MASIYPPEEPEIVQFGGEPEYFVTDTRTEPAGNGNVRVFAYAMKHGVLHLLYTAVFPAAVLLNVSRRSADTSKEVLSGLAN